MVKPRTSEEEGLGSGRKKNVPVTNVRVLSTAGNANGSRGNTSAHSKNITPGAGSTQRKSYQSKFNNHKSANSNNPMVNPCRNAKTRRAFDTDVLDDDSFEICNSETSYLPSNEEVTSDDEGSGSDIETLPASSEFLLHSFSGRKSTSLNRRYIGNYGNYFVGELDHGKMYGIGTLFSRDGREFFVGKWTNNKLIELQLCQLVMFCSWESRDNKNNETIIRIAKQTDLYLLGFENDHFVARATIHSTQEIPYTESFSIIKRHLFRMLTIVSVIEDALQSSRDSVLHNFQETLTTLTNGTSADQQAAAFLSLLKKYSKQCWAEIVLCDMQNDVNIPQILRTQAMRLLSSENTFLARKYNMFIYDKKCQPAKLDMNEIMGSACASGIEQFRQVLIKTCPVSLPSICAQVAEIPEDKILFVNKADIELFRHLASLTTDPHILNFLVGLQDDFFEMLKTISNNRSVTDVQPLTNPSYSFLFKSFFEIISEIVSKESDSTVEDMLNFENGEWALAESIPWLHSLQSSQTVTQKSVEDMLNFKNGEWALAESIPWLHSLQSSQTVTQKSLFQLALECQYRFIFKLMNHFQPGRFNKKNKFQYCFSILLPPSVVKSKTWWQQQLITLSEVLGTTTLHQKTCITCNMDLHHLPDERLVWVYILDHIVSELLPNECGEKPNPCIELFGPILKSHVHFVLSSPSDNHESFRIVTHSILKFISRSAPYFLKTEVIFDRDTNILKKQLDRINDLSYKLGNDLLVFDNFRNLINEYNRYWSLRELLPLNSAPFPMCIGSEVDRLSQKLFDFVSLALDKNVLVKPLVDFYRSLNDFFDDFKDFDFLSTWYVKKCPNSCTGYIEQINNKLANEAQCSYRVTDVKKYVESHELLCSNIPPHYIVLVISRLFECVLDCLNKQWEGLAEDELSVPQLEGATLLVGSIRTSFLYFKEQPDYRDFDLFKNESIEPFVRVIDNCQTLEDFKKRIDIVKESFWYVRKMDEIGVEKALEMFKKVNDSLNADKLKGIYDLYLKEFQRCIEQHSLTLDNQGLNLIIESVKKRVTNCQINVTKWTKEFKSNEIPLILGGLSASWSLMVSEDVSGTGKFLKPHCIQVLCVLRLLSADVEKSGTDNHLAQVLTGQGKSVILGLVAALLALTGHKVRVLCYSKYLASRDKKDFEKFFTMFDIMDKIKYGTFEHMANEFVNPVIDGKEFSLRNIISNLILDHGSQAILRHPDCDTSNSVLLIDEVDVFFSDMFYGDTYRAGSAVNIPGLPEIQETIWKIVSSRNYRSVQDVLKFVHKFIESQVKCGNNDMIEFNKFLYTPGKFSLLVAEGACMSIKSYTNQTLFQEHLEDMIDAAKQVASNLNLETCKLDNNGFICCRSNKTGEFVYTSMSYFIMFRYFKLKGCNFDSKSLQNYGNLVLDAGTISYAKLPEEYPLILGVSGTLNNLFDFEKKAMKESYNINSLSILPSFFGESNLLFNQDIDFKVLSSEKEWCTAILDCADAAIRAERSVLIFFDTDTELNTFNHEYRNKYDRLNVLTINSEQELKELYIDEAGVASTVTLATREMGRGVDYKSSASVEKRGGVHVIQTFFSLDVKEETQIKGRTARKDNKGTYELVLCKAHLVKAELLSDGLSNAHDYASLHETRTYLMNVKGNKNAARILQSEESHKKTMEFFGLSKR